MNEGAQFGLHVTESARGPVVVVAGELDLATSDQLAECLLDLVGQSVTLDFSGVTFMDSTAINVLIAAQKRAATDGRELLLRGVQPAQMRVFDIVGLTEHLNFDGSQETA